MESFWESITELYERISDFINSISFEDVMAAFSGGGAVIGAIIAVYIYATTAEEVRLLMLFPPRPGHHILSKEIISIFSLDKG